MHHVDRGPEPIDLAPIRAQHTQRWIRFHRDGLGTKPSDSHWRRFAERLEKVFWGLCAFCEECCKGEVEHFLPKSLYPHFVYYWSNWLFSCHDCNNSKGKKWPELGYVDPCAFSKLSRPEVLFYFDTTTGEILPRDDLNPLERQKAEDTIYDLGLNDRHHLQKRTDWLGFVSGLFQSAPGNLTETEEKDCKYFSSHAAPFSSIVKTWLSDHGY